MLLPRAAPSRRNKSASKPLPPPEAVAPLDCDYSEDEDEGRALLLTPKSISFVALISSIFTLTYLWFRHGIFSAWDSLAFRPSDLVKVRTREPEGAGGGRGPGRGPLAPVSSCLALDTGSRRASPLRPPFSLFFPSALPHARANLLYSPPPPPQGLRPNPGFALDSDEQAQFAFIAASTHTVVVVVGMLLLTGTRIILRRTSFMSGFPPNVRRVAELLTASVLSYAFYLVLYTWFTFTFATQRGKAYLWARSFFYEEVGGGLGRKKGAPTFLPAHLFLASFPSLLPTCLGPPGVQGEKPFASCASVSYILCLVAGYLIKYSTMEVGPEAGMEAPWRRPGDAPTPTPARLPLPTPPRLSPASPPGPAACGSTCGLSWPAFSSRSSSFATPPFPFTAT